MSYPAKTVLYFGIYMLLEGLVLLVTPNTLLSLVGLSQTHEIWVRFVGITFLVLSYYYINAAKKELRVFFTWTVHVRIVQFLIVLAVVFVTSVSPVFLLFAGIELCSGLWTLQALKAKKK